MPTIGVEGISASPVRDSHIDVVAGVIHNATQTEILLALRKPEQHQGDRWEFPGGKLEIGERPDHGLIRELEEELGITALSVTPLTTLDHTYPEKSVRLYFLEVTRFSGNPVGREGQELRWVPTDKLREYRFPEANEVVVELLMSRLRNNALKLSR